MEKNFDIPQHGLHLRLLFYQLVKLDGMRLKTEGILILCLVAVLAKTCFEKFAPKIRRLVRKGIEEAGNKNARRVRMEIC